MKILLDDIANVPERKHPQDAGLDLKSPKGKSYAVPPRGRVFINTGVHVELPTGCVGLIKSRSGLNRDGLQVEGVIDENYRGAIGLTIYNHSDQMWLITPNERIAQLVIVECLYPDIEIVNELSDTDRGTDGFGSTGK